jgi:hypothetical protein
MTTAEFRSKCRKLTIVAFFIGDVILAVLALEALNLIFAKC